MGAFHASATQTTAKTASRGPTLVAGNKDVELIEVGVEATTADGSTVALRRLTTAGTTGTAIDEVIGEDDGQAPTAAASQAPSTDHTLTAGNIRTAHLPTAIGGGVIWTFDPPLRIRGGSGDGVALVLPSGTDRIINFHFTWIE